MGKNQDRYVQLLRVLMAAHDLTIELDIHGHPSGWYVWDGEGSSGGRTRFIDLPPKLRTTALHLWSDYKD